MFTGFASENTPAIQVWDFFRTFASTSAIRSVSLPDDCAPVQVFRTGAAGTSIRVYLPTAPIEGKQITIVNQQYGGFSQSIAIYSSDTSDNGSSSSLFTLGQGDSLVLVYSKQNITYGTSVGFAQTGWIPLNKSSPTAFNYYSAIVGGNTNSASASYCFIGGGVSNSASGTYATVVGGNSNSASGVYAAAVGGNNNTASNTNAVVVGGAASTANSSNAAVVGGSNHTASNSNAAVVGGFQSTASGLRSSVVGGDTNSASGTNSFIGGGLSNTANSNFSSVIGGSRGTTRLIIGSFVVAASNAPISSTAGTQQLGTLLLGRQTTDATATVLASDSNAASTANQVILPNNSAYTFQGTCIANVTGGGNTSGWKFEGVIKRGANAASTALVAAVTPTVIAQDAGASTWVLAITADTTNGGIAVTVTGQASTTIRWVAKIETTEVTF